MFCNKVLLLRSEDLILQLGETTDLGNDAWFMMFVQCYGTEDYVEYFRRPLVKHTTEDKCLEYQLSRTHCVSVCADGASVITRTKKINQKKCMKKKNRNV